MIAHNSSISISRLCTLLGMTRGAFYQHYKRKQIVGTVDALVLEWVRQVRKNQPRIGGRKLHVLLKDKFTEHGIKMGQAALFDLLRNYGLTLRRKRRRIVVTTLSRHRYKKYPNLIKYLPIDRPNYVWVADMDLPRA